MEPIAEKEKAEELHLTAQELIKTLFPNARCSKRGKRWVVKFSRNSPRILAVASTQDKAWTSAADMYVKKTKVAV